MLNKTGIPTKQHVLSVFPATHELSSLKAIIECYEEIPCNPCESHCPFDAIIVGKNINTRPQLIVDRCVGCGICVAICPGVAIMLAKVNEQKASFTIPYEFNPKPNVQDVWHAINREGHIIGDAVITRVVDTPKQNHTALISVVVDRTLLHDFITIRSKDE
jgi:Fe-S-cluster-containing hydrogenase component 2